MSLEFIKKGINKKDVDIAARQERQIKYLVISDIQDDQLTTEYYKQWAERKYQTNDYFLNYIKSIFREENFLTFFRYMRFPLPSSKLVNNKIKPQLHRVFRAEDSEFKYDVYGKQQPDFMPILRVDEFTQKCFNSYFTAHNSIAICELESDKSNTPFRYLIDIKDVVSISQNINDQIDKIAYKACIVIEGQKRTGIIYIDSNQYQFFANDNKTQIADYSASHDLGYCPAFFISPVKYGNSWVIRESLFTYIREEMEEYNFLKTLQKMTEPNGAIPVVTKLETSKNNSNQTQQPKTDGLMGGQSPELNSTNPPQDSGILQPGTVHEIPPIDKDNGGFDMDVVDKFINFHYVPTEILDYLNTRIKEIEQSILTTIVGDAVSSSEASKNESQIEKSVSVLENVLFMFATSLNKIRKFSDTAMLQLMYGVNRVNEVFIWFGSDFYLETQAELFEMLKIAPNTLERKELIKRISRNKYKNNIDQLTRQDLLYDLIPYVSDIDFDKAINSIDPITKQYQLRFNYWIGLFEAKYDDIVSFYNALDFERAEKITLINSLIIQIIKENEQEFETSSTPENGESYLA